MSSILTLDQIRTKCPAAFSESPAQHTSPDYKFVKTSSIIEELDKNNWCPIFAKGQKCRNVEDRDYTKHSILFRQRELAISLPAIGGGMVPTITLINSHNWSCTLKILFGMLVLRCGNGLTAHGQQFACYTINHSTIMEDIINILESFEAQKNRIENTFSRWNQIELDSDQIHEFHVKAAEIRFGENPTDDQVMVLRNRIRDEDKGNTLFLNFNGAQEQMIKGGSTLNRRRMRSVSNIERERQLNEDLFLLASSYDKELN